MPTLDVREIPPPERHPKIHDTFAEMDRGEVLEIVNDHETKPLFYEMQAEVEAFDADEYEVEREGDEVPAHRHPEREIMVYLASGRLDVRVDGESNVLEPGNLLRFDGRDEVSPKAEADSTALLVLAPRSDEK